MARRSFYYDKVEPNLRLIKEWLSDGVGIKEICQWLEVPSTSWYEYISKYPEFAEIVNLGNNDRMEAGELTDDIIENAKFTLTVLVQHDRQGLDEEDEWVLEIRKYETLRSRIGGD